MCGIAGLLGIPPHLAEAAAPRMLAAMRHRGPDDSDVAVVPHVRGHHPPAVLLHTRLAILDLTSAGHQPMPDRPMDPSESANWIVFNGEVFNFLELRAELEEAGRSCHTRCDTETILHAYRLWGASCVERFRGMFAWCLLDTKQGTAWFCRDRLGIKPLYLARPRCGGLLFASEVRTLLAAGPELVPPRVNASAVESFLAQGAVCGLESIVEGIELLAPGEWLQTDWSGESQNTRKYWQAPFIPYGEKPVRSQSTLLRAGAVTRMADTLRDAVKLRLIADVPLGLFLSGGIDSGALATVAKEVNGSVRTITVGFDQPEFDESETAESVAKILRTEHVSLRLTGHDLLDDLPGALAAIDQPTVDGFNTYFVSRAARRAGLKVALSGLGGDELFGGYASFRDVPRAVRWRRQLRKIGQARRWLAPLFRWTGRRGGMKTAELLLRKPTPLHVYLLRRELFLPAERRALHSLPPKSDPFSGLPRTIMEDLADQGRLLDPINQVSAFELNAYMRNMLLRDADVLSMAHGLELRVPLLDHRLVEQAAALPGAFKQPDPRPKSLLIDAVGKRLPKSVYARPKRGFTFPWDAWLRGPLKERAARSIRNADVWSALGMSPQGPVRLWQRFLENDHRLAALQVVALLVLEDYATRHGLTRAA